MTSISSARTFARTSGNNTCTVFIDEASGRIELWANDGLISVDELPDLKAAIAFIESVLAERQRGGDYETGRDFGDENHPGTPVTGTLEGRWDDALPVSTPQRKATCGTCDYFAYERIGGTLTGWCDADDTHKPLDGSGSRPRHRPKPAPRP